MESDNVDAESELTYSKQIFSQDESETEILDLDWNKISNKISVAIPSMKEKKATKKKTLTIYGVMLHFCNKIFSSFLVPSHTSFCFLS